MPSPAAPEHLLQAVPGPQPCGEDLSFSVEFDTIAELRREDDASLPLGEWKEKGKEPKVADWPALCALCDRLLRTRSKDLRLAGWLADGWARQRGLAGLAEGLALATGLVTRWWDEVHPQPEGGDMEQRVGALRWLLSRVPPLAREAAAAAPRRADALAALQALQGLQEAVDTRLGAEGPGFMAARESLQAVLADLPAAPEGLPPDTRTAESSAPALSAVAHGPGPAGAPQTRAQALEQLRQVAEFFRRTEPHSPVAYLADKAAHWGSMDLATWLRAVVKDHGSLSQLEELLGVQPPGQT